MQSDEILTNQMESQGIFRNTIIAIYRWTLNFNRVYHHTVRFFNTICYDSLRLASNDTIVTLMSNRKTSWAKIVSSESAITFSIYVYYVRYGVVFVHFVNKGLIFFIWFMLKLWDSIHMCIYLYFQIEYYNYRLISISKLDTGAFWLQIWIKLNLVFPDSNLTFIFNISIKIWLWIIR